MFLLILDLFALGGEKESKYNKRTTFWGFVQQPLALERRIYTSFWTILVLDIFW